jgi:hypothetical protein
VDAYQKEFGVPPSPEVITHCRRELIHAVINLILQGRFAEVYKNGIVITFPDGVARRVFPRFYCYSADYPEKYVHSATIPDPAANSPKRILIANIKNLGKCPCPRCLIQMEEVQDLGKANDIRRRSEKRKPSAKLFAVVKKARRAIFKGSAVSGTLVEKILGGKSRVAINVCSTASPWLIPYVMLIMGYGPLYSRMHS